MSVYDITKFGTISMDEDGVLVFDNFCIETDEDIIEDKHKYLMLMAITELLQKELYKVIKHLESVGSSVH